VEVWQTSNLRQLRLGKEKRLKKKTEETTRQKDNGLPYDDNLFNGVIKPVANKKKRKENNYR